MTINAKLVFTKDVPGVKGIILQFFESSTTKHFTNYVIPTIDCWISQNQEHFTTIAKNGQAVDKPEEAKLSTDRILPVASKTVEQFS